MAAAVEFFSASHVCVCGGDDALRKVKSHFPEAKFHASEEDQDASLSAAGQKILLISVESYAKNQSKLCGAASGMPPWLVSIVQCENKRTLLSATERRDIESKNAIVKKFAKGFQKENIMRAIEQEGRFIFADEMGLGKTCMALGTALHYRICFEIFFLRLGIIVAAGGGVFIIRRVGAFSIHCHMALFWLDVRFFGGGAVDILLRIVIFFTLAASAIRLFFKTTTHG